MHYWTTQSAHICPVSQTYLIHLKRALGGPEAAQWKAAMDEEYDTLIKMGTWEKETLPEGRKTVGCKWVFTKKRDEHGNIIKLKARLWCRDSHRNLVQTTVKTEHLPPVMRFETLRTLLAFTAIHNLKLRQFDVKGAYLHGYVSEKIYMIQPPGYEDGTGLVCRLVRSLYGLKQAGNVWNHELNRALNEIGFTQLKTDYCSYIRRDGINFTVLLVWVDDIIAISTSDALNDKVEEELKAKFDVKSLGQPIHATQHKITSR